MSESASPVFLHSLFRSGSTYFFNVFRRSPINYWCYQEPENEILLELADTADPIADNAKLSSLLRHPRLDKPYLAEFMPIRDDVVRLFKRHFPYDDFFLADREEASDLRCYIELLIERARGRPLLQLCRSTGRIGWLRENFGGQHLFVWRHPWDQWWSYKVAPYFDTANLLILNARQVPPVFERVRVELGFLPHHDTTLKEEFAYFDSNGLSDAESYLLFYAIWYHAMHEGLQNADLVIGIDSLSYSPEYRHTVLEKMATLGIEGLDFSDCTVPQIHHMDSDRAFFRPIEERVERIFSDHGYDKTSAARINELRAQIPRNELDPLTELGRLRDLARQNFSATARTKHLLWKQRLEIERLTRCEAELMSIYQSRPWKLMQPFLRMFWHLRARLRNRWASTRSDG